MLIRRMVDHQIEDDLHPSFMRLIDQHLTIFQSPIRTMYILEIGDVIAHVDLGTSCNAGLAR
jgi:hypothetical protein